MDIMNNLFNSGKKNKLVNDLQKIGIPPGKYRIYDDLSVDVFGDFSLKDKVAQTWTVCPIKFATIFGNFIWHYGSLTTLENMPRKVNKNYSVAYNNLKNLKYSPYSIGENFVVSGNKLRDLKGCPSKIGGYLFANNCALRSLEGAPEILSSLMVANNELTNLDFLPTTIYDTLDISNNKITSPSLENLKPIIEKLRKFNFADNPCEEFFNNYIKSKSLSNKNSENDNIDEPSVHIPSDIDTSEINFQINDQIILNSEHSRYNKFKGKITEVHPNNSYDITFGKDDNPSLVKNAILMGVKPHYLQKIPKSFKIEDYVIFNNSTSKFDGIKGEIVEITMVEGKPKYKIKVLLSENPNIKDLVTQASKNKGWVNIKDIRSNELSVSQKTEPLTLNKFKPWDVVMHFGSKATILRHISGETYEI